MIALQNCNSKTLQAYGYDAATGILAVRFSAGKVYHYQGVPPDVYEKLSAAESIGSAFASLIRGQFEHNVILDEPEATTQEG